MKRNENIQNETREIKVVSSLVNVPVSRERHEDKYVTKQAEQLYEKYGYLVPLIVNKYTKPYKKEQQEEDETSVPKLRAYMPEDLSQEGLMALWKAAEDYDPEKGPFVPYAWWLIERKVKDALMHDKQHVHIPEDDQTLINKIKREINAFMQLEFREPTVSELADRLNEHNDSNKPITEDDIFDVMPGLSYSCVSLDNCAGSDDDGDYLSFAELLPDTDAAPADYLVHSENVIEDILRVANALPSAREREIFSRKYERNEDFATIGKDLGLGRERVRQICVDACRHIHERLKKG